MLWNRKYPPIKSKNTLIMTLVMASACNFFVTQLAGNGHIPLAGTTMTNCKVHGLWFCILLGSCFFSYLIALRIYGLYRVFHLGKPFRGPSFYLPFALYFLCIFIYGIVSQLISPRLTIRYMEELDICNQKNGYKVSVFALLWLTWILIAVMSWKIRNIKSSFNESREIMIACFMVFTTILFATIMHYAYPRFPLNSRLRIATTTLVHIALNSVWWLIMAKPLYMCLFHKEKYLQEWLLKLRQDGLQQAYDVDSRGTSGMVALGSYNASVSMLINEKGNGHNVGSFYATDESGIQGHESRWEGSDHKHTSLIVPSEDALDVQKPAYNQGTLPISMGKPILSSALNSGDSPPRARPVSPRLVPESQKVCKPIAFPDQAHIAPLSLTDAQRRNLDKYCSEERNLI
ncbi:hypothetical protein LPJ56_000568 [Coemansia sp. RSA 2599]|nr:hypothetical protein LPJ56_000568 [Coemansia sp. RSA 2599]